MKERKKWPQYVVRRCKKNAPRYPDEDDLFGLSHGMGNRDLETVCGKDATGWCITHNEWDGEITCKKCLKILEKALSHE